MAKQEEILQGIERSIRLGVCAYQDLGFDNKKMYHMIALRVRERLHSQGVVVKVERELPDEIDCPCEGPMSSAEWMRDLMIEEGYVTVEPLIKED